MRFNSERSRANNDETIEQIEICKEILFVVNYLDVVTLIIGIVKINFVIHVLVWILVMDQSMNQLHYVLIIVHIYMGTEMERRFQAADNNIDIANDNGS